MKNRKKLNKKLRRCSYPNCTAILSTRNLTKQCFHHNVTDLITESEKHKRKKEERELLANRETG